MLQNTPDLSGALNLLQNCMDVQASDTVLLVCESPALGWYDEEATEVLGAAIQQIGAAFSMIEVGHPDEPLPVTYKDMVNQSSAIIYLSRIGDQDRFTDKLPGKKVAMLYVRDGAALQSEYASIDHNAMKHFKTSVDRIMTSAKRITITCPLGSEIECTISPEDYSPKNCYGGGDVAVKRFPLCVPQPILAKEMSGRVALADWLTPTGSRSYSPAVCKIDDVVFAEVEAGRITGFHGDNESVSRIEKHYEFVSKKFAIDKYIVHSWHAGIHPACSYPHNINDDPDRWSNNIFGSPRYVHFHTCGAYPPGEICWMVRDPTIQIDGTSLWEKGRLMYNNFPQTKDVTNLWPTLRNLLNTGTI